MIEAATVPLHQRETVRQFVKFCIVGASSFAIDTTTAFVLHYYGHLAVLLANTISFSLGVTNGFYWNRTWTFRHARHGIGHEQYAKFVGVNIVGLALSLGIIWAVIGAATSSWTDQHPTKPIFLAAKVLATAVVVFWNFFANKHWTFKHRP